MSNALRTALNDTTAPLETFIPGPVNATEADAAAIVRRAPTAKEIAETAAIAANAADEAAELADLEACVDLAEFAGRRAAVAAVAEDRNGYTSILGTALAMLCQNLANTKAGRVEQPALDDHAMNGVFAAMCQSGITVYRNKAGTTDSDDKVAEICAMDDATARYKAAYAYARDFGTGRNLEDTAEKLQTNAKRLVRFFREDETALEALCKLDADKANRLAAYVAFRKDVATLTESVTKGRLVRFLSDKYAVKRGGKGKGKAAPDAAAIVAAHPAPSADTVKLADLSVTAPAPVTAPVAAVAPGIMLVNRDVSSLSSADRLAYVLEIAAGLDDSDMAALYQRIGAMRDVRREQAEAAKLEAMRIERDAAAKVAAETAETVLAVELAMAGQPKRRTLSLPAPVAVAA